MSVINQMLKELDERNDTKGNVSGGQAALGHQESSSTFKIALIIFLVIVINICGIYVWGLYSENKTLKNVVLTNSQISPESEPKQLPSPAFIKEESTEVDIATVDKDIPASTNNSTINIDNETEQQTIDEPQEPQAPITKEVQRIIKEDNVVITPINDLISENSIDKTIPTDSIVKKEKQSSLSISRSKLSPERVVQNKLQKAEQAIIDNDIPKAEKLFEDVLLIQPDHKGARKQLSALWFGRKLFRPALNLLSQGMAIYPDDIDFRLMKARILLNQNQNKEALYVLNGFAEAPSVEYQVLLANTAQSLSAAESVILAYQQLVILESHKSKWWMGLAVALDRDSQFNKAKKSYGMALSTGNLSSNSAQFIRQRMSELGE